MIVKQTDLVVHTGAVGAREGTLVGAGYYCGGGYTRCTFLPGAIVLGGRGIIITGHEGGKQNGEYDTFFHGSDFFGGGLNILVRRQVIKVKITTLAEINCADR